MRLARALSLSSVAGLLALAALPMMACQDRKPAGEAGVGAPDAAPSASAPAAAGSQKRGAAARRGDAPRDDRFDAKIAENLPRVPDPAIQLPEMPGSPGVGAGLDNATFRDRVIAFVRQVSAGGEKVACELPLTSRRPFRAVVSAYRQGEKVGRGEASDAVLCAALKDATRRVVAASGGDGKALAGARFVVELPDHDESMVEHEGKGLELDHGLVPVRVLDKALLGKRIDEGKGYLLRVLDPERNGAHKYYHATTDRFEDELHTIYSASTALTLLKLHAYKPDKRLLDKAVAAAGFMLSMQSHDEQDRTAGAFYYSFDLKKKRPERKLVVGTASKTIFTLLELHALNKEKKYLDAALQAADWLVSMQRPDGSVRSYLRQGDGDRWMVVKKESMLYTGQVLSALSRVYRATRDTKYLDAAAQTAGYLAGKVAEKGCYVGDDYRKPNPISSSWLILSLLDFTKATGDAQFERTTLRCADDLLKRQRRKPEDVYRYGRFQGSLSSSGNGWLAEVMSELFLHCKEKKLERCDRFKEAVVMSMRLLMQYTYSPENAFVVKNLEASTGGVFWSVPDRYVRTDSVCHAMNAYLHMIGHLGDGPLIEVPERPLADRLALGAEAATAQGPADEERDEPAGDDPEETGMSKVPDPAEEAVEKGPAATKP